MRMWNVNPKYLCRKHLLGEHVETHMFIGTIKKGKKLDGYVRNGLVEVHNLKRRHDELSREMISRGFNHKTEMNYSGLWELGVVDTQKNIEELKSRCKDCKCRITMLQKHFQENIS